MSDGDAADAVSLISPDAAVITNDIDCLVLGCSTVLLHTQFSHDATAKQIQYENLFSFEGAVHQPVLGWLNGQEAKALSYLAALRRIKCHKLRGSKSLDCLSQSGLCVKKLADLACQLQRLSPDDRFDFCE